MPEKEIMEIIIFFVTQFVFFFILGLRRKYLKKKAKLFEGQKPDWNNGYGYWGIHNEYYQKNWEIIKKRVFISTTLFLFSFYILYFIWKFTS